MKGLVYEWAFVLIGIIVLTLFYILINEAYDTGGIYNFGNTNIRASDTTARTALGVIDVVWRYLPLAFLFLVFFYVIVKSQQRNYPFE